MSVTRVFAGLVLLVLLSMGWRFSRSDAVQAWLHPPDRRSAAIVFDNGTVRQTEAASGPVELGDPIRPPGGMRKCKKGKETVYTDRSCPPGTHEAVMANGTVNVLPGHAGQSPAPPDGRSPAGRLPPAAAIRDVLDVNDQGQLRQRRIEQVANP